MNARDSQRVETAIRFLAAHADEQPTLAEVAARVGLSPSHFQRVFQRLAGVSPKRFLQCLTVEDAKAWLARSRSVLDTTYRVGLSGPGRLHDHFVTLEAVTPGEYKAHGAGLVIRYGMHATPLGRCLIAVTERGVCRVEFGAEGGLDRLRRDWPGAAIAQDAAATQELASHLLAGAPAGGLRMLVRGTNFQVQVWRALLRIPAGAVVTYGDVARAIDRPAAVRAVGTAVGRNPVAVLIPCHRVVRASGALGGYRWGLDRKRALLALDRVRGTPAGATPPRTPRDPPSGRAAP